MASLPLLYSVQKTLDFLSLRDTAGSLQHAYALPSPLDPLWPRTLSIFTRGKGWVPLPEGLLWHLSRPRAKNLDSPHLPYEADWRISLTLVTPPAPGTPFRLVYTERRTHLAVSLTPARLRAHAPAWSVLDGEGTPNGVALSPLPPDWDYLFWRETIPPEPRYVPRLIRHESLVHPNQDRTLWHRSQLAPSGQRSRTRAIKVCARHTPTGALGPLSHQTVLISPRAIAVVA